MTMAYEIEMDGDKAIESMKNLSWNVLVQTYLDKFSQDTKNPSHQIFLYAFKNNIPETKCSFIRAVEDLAKHTNAQKDGRMYLECINNSILRHVLTLKDLQLEEYKYLRMKKMTGEDVKHAFEWVRDNYTRYFPESLNEVPVQVPKQNKVIDITTQRFSNPKSDISTPEEKPKKKRFVFGVLLKSIKDKINIFSMMGSKESKGMSVLDLDKNLDSTEKSFDLFLKSLAKYQEDISIFIDAKSEIIDLISGIDTILNMVISNENKWIKAEKDEYKKSAYTNSLNLHLKRLSEVKAFRLFLKNEHLDDLFEFLKKVPKATLPQNTGDYTEKDFHKNFIKKFNIFKEDIRKKLSQAQSPESKIILEVVQKKITQSIDTRVKDFMEDRKQQYKKIIKDSFYSDKSDFKPLLDKRNELAQTPEGEYISDKYTMCDLYQTAVYVHLERTAALLSDYGDMFDELRGELITNSIAEKFTLQKKYGNQILVSYDKNSNNGNLLEWQK
ncbi:hypothetical protein COB57_01995 [Candidatus Peregrinibacteria bacterium]|nr:MAG: hypothetical protein COB57_01995 [Candidatus Peregrinibacteria bacterium]